MDETVCHCCLSPELETVERCGAYRHQRCPRCGLEHFVRQGKGAERTLYEEDGDYEDDLALSGNHRDLLQWQHLAALRFIGELEGNPSLLDVGCFNGFFVKEVERRGFRGYGIDVNRKAVRYGIEKYGLMGRIAAREVTELVKEERRFDVVTLFDVIEHLEDPRRLLMQVRELLSENGTLILSTPNNRMVWRPPLDFPPHHLSRYHPHTLRRLLTCTGFVMLRHEEQMSLFNLARNYAGTLFRDRTGKGGSLRGGRLGNRGWTVPARRVLNRTRALCQGLLYPADRVLHFFGMRYLEQLAVLRKVEFPAAALAITSPLPEVEGEQKNASRG